MMPKRRRQSCGEIVEDERLYIPSKIAALRASSCVVKVTHRFKLDQPHGFRLKELRYIEDGLVKLTGSGIIIECEEVNEATYHSIVFTHATLFTRSYCETSNLNEIPVDVSLSDGKVCKTEIIACDFHYNLAALKVTSDTPLQPAKIRSLDDTISIDPTQEFPRNLEGNSFELRPHSNLFKYSPGVSVIALGRHRGNTLYTSVGSLSMKLSTLEFSDLFRLTGDFDDVCVGGPVINYSGEVIGIMLHSNSFLPSNIFLRWWKHYKSYRELRRPWIGFGVANLYAVHASHLEKFMGKFPSVSTGVFVEEVELDSPAYFSGIRDSDVIIQFNGVPIRSTLEFFEKTWDKVGESVELEVLRERTGDQLNLTTMIGELTPDKCNRWLAGAARIHAYSLPCFPACARQLERVTFFQMMAINDAAKDWGLKCLCYEIKDISPPCGVKAAMEMQAEAERKKRAPVLESEGERQAHINIADGKKSSVILASEAAKMDQVNRAQGELPIWYSN